MDTHSTLHAHPAAGDTLYRIAVPVFDGAGRPLPAPRLLWVRDALAHIAGELADPSAGDGLLLPQVIIARASTSIEGELRELAWTFAVTHGHGARLERIRPELVTVIDHFVSRMPRGTSPRSMRRSPR